MPEKTKRNVYREAQFLTSAARIDQLPPDEGREVAFAGRSNAGKSSALNTLTEQRNLARTSKTPGRTQLINLFEIDDTRRLVDLPGYGYAKVPAELKRRWSATLEKYLEQRQCLTGLILIMDIRHPLKEFDQMMLEWARQSNMPVHVLLTKADKLKRGPANNILLKVKKQLSEMHPHASVQLFSALKREGSEQLQGVLDGWLGFGSGETEDNPDPSQP